jgi:peptidase E
VYGDDSAGACLAGPSLHDIELADNPEDAPEAIFTGLALVKFAIVPRWGNKKNKSYYFLLDRPIA